MVAIIIVESSLEVQGVSVVKLDVNSASKIVVVSGIDVISSLELDVKSIVEIAVV